MTQQRWRLVSKDRKTFIESVKSPLALKALEDVQGDGFIQSVCRTNPETVSLGVCHPISMVMNA